MRSVLLAGVVAVASSVTPVALGSSAPTTTVDLVRPAASQSDPNKRLHSDELPRRELTAPATNAVATIAQPVGHVYVPVAPYRTFDSRLYVNGRLSAGDEHYFDVLTDVDGVPRIPPQAVAVTYNLAVAGTYGAGGRFLAVYPANLATWPGNASINWTQPGTILSNGGTVAIGTHDGPGQIAVYCGGVRVAADYVIDITGYYI